MQEQEISQILETQDISSLNQLIESKKNLSEIQLVQYLEEVFNQKKRN